MRGGIRGAGIEQPAEEGTHLRSKDEERSKQATRRPGGVRSSTQNKSKHKDERKERERLRALERALCERITATGQPRRKPRQRSYRRTDDRGANFYRPAREVVRQRERAEEHAVVGDTEHASDNTQCDAQKIAAERW